MSIHSYDNQNNSDLFSVDLAEGLQDLDRVLFAQKLNKLHQPKPEQKIDRDRLAALLDDWGDHAAASRLQHCGEGGLGWIGICSENPDHPRKYIPFYCELRICPECAARRSRALAGEITQPIIDYVASVPKWRGYKLRHVVLTTRVPLEADTSEVAQKLRDWRIGIRKMFQDLFPADDHLGGIIGAEFGETGRKLHFHILLFSKWIVPDDLGAAWQALTGSDGQIFKIKLVDTSNIHKAIFEVCKYATKPAKFQGEDLEALLARLHIVLKGIRRIQSFGSFYNLKRKGKSDLCCPECGAVLDWLPELAVIDQPAAGGRSNHECTSLNLIHPNNLNGVPPPEQPNNLLLPFEGGKHDHF